MTDTRPGEMTIGRFSSLTRISVRMLRHYDEHGVLVPARIDPATGYRWYGSEQLDDAVDIRRLRDLGVSVSAIRAILATRGTPEYERALRLQRSVLADEAHLARQRLRLIDTMLDDLHKETTMTTVQHLTLPATTVATMRRTIPDYSSEGVIWQEFLPALAAQGHALTGPCGVIEHDEGYRESDVDESAFAPVPDGTELSPPLAVLRFGPREVVMARVTGPYGEAIPRAHDEISRYLTANGITPAWTADDPATHVFNRYLSDPAATAEEDLLTEVYVPVHG